MTEGDLLLRTTLSVLRDHGHIGQPLDEAIAHADRYVDLVPGGPGTLVDLGSGGGLPALVIAVRRPDLRVTMVERRRTRADELQRAQSALGILTSTEVFSGDVAALIASGAVFDVVTARSFGPPLTTLRCAADLVRRGGTVLISDPPSDVEAHWQTARAAVPELVDGGAEQGIRRFTRV